MLKQRILVALVLLPPFTWILYLANPFPFYLMLAVGLVLALIELGRMIEKRGLKFEWTITFMILLGMLAVNIFPQAISARLGFSRAAILLSLILFSLLALGLRQIFSGYHEQCLATIGANQLAVLSIIGIGIFLFMLRQLPQGSIWLILLFGFNWIYDAGALFVGAWLGKHKLAASISPAKTVEGLVGGLVINGLVAAIFYFIGLPKGLPFSLAGFVLLGISLGALAQAGDLAESMVKRWSGTKNSSSLLPGHGGILDKIDNILFTAPFLYFVARILVGG